ncbi:putative Serine/threonine-protein phosphatase PGAM5, mitochondrial [Hypsibius exemplaris]|uniref:Serine/threonine-protein phosphatase PGAM5, mitochondrial n=1 Tax=Hypsibius exemplaris TaxID=2072580 RepID=A0A9X6RKY9_HYPEX|nr:putative Serine/threonine-protein phosphatase PGAM5, mitochondrial [Hypsibius exemplaris]
MSSGAGFPLLAVVLVALFTDYPSINASLEERFRRENSSHLRSSHTNDQSDVDLSDFIPEPVVEKSPDDFKKTWEALFSANVSSLPARIKEPPSESNMEYGDAQPRQLQEVRFVRLRPVGEMQKIKNAARTTVDPDGLYPVVDGVTVASSNRRLVTTTNATRSPAPTPSDESRSRQVLFRLQLGKDEAEQRLEQALNELQELKVQLNATAIERTNAKEYGRIMENSYSALKLENDMLARSSNSERLKNRKLQDELADARNNAAKINNTNDSQSSWDTKETIYQGDRWHRNWDGREPPMGPANVTGTRVIFFIRHGHYEFSEPEEYIALTDLGKKQMEAVGLGLSLLKYRWNRAFLHSSKLRTQQAAEIIAKHIPGLILKPSHLIWSCSYDNDSERRQEAFKEYIFRASPRQNRTSYELVMTHSSVIRYFVERSLQVTYGTIALPLIHGSITRIEIPPDGRVILREFGEYSHMPRELLSLSNAKWRAADNTGAPHLSHIFFTMNNDRGCQKNFYLDESDASFNVVYGPEEDEDEDEEVTPAPFLPASEPSPSRSRDLTDRNSHTWTLFQDAAANTSKLYQARSSGHDAHWLNFQNAASSISMLYKESLEQQQQRYDAGFRAGVEKGYTELVEWIVQDPRYHTRKHIRTDDLLNFIYSPQNPAIFAGKMRGTKGHEKPNPPVGLSGSTTGHHKVEDLEAFRDALSVSSLNGAMSNFCVNRSPPRLPHGSSPPRSTSRPVDLHAFVTEELRRHKRSNSTAFDEGVEGNDDGDHHHHHHNHQQPAYKRTRFSPPRK